MRRIFAFVAAVTTGLCSARAGVLDWLLPKHDVEVITVTDTTPAGALRRPPSPTSPIYYAAVSMGYRELGGVIAGEKIPPNQDVIKTLAKVMAKQGYLPATKAHPPTVLLMWVWGTLNTDRIYDPSNPDDTEGRQVNRQAMLRFLGAYKLGMVSQKPEPFADEFIVPGLMFREPNAEAIYDAATDDLYVAAIAAYDYAAAEKKQKVLLWTTKISCPSRGLSLPTTLPAMLAIAGPNIGKETAKPVWANATEHFKPEVKIGDPKVVEYIDNSPLPVVDMAGSPLKKPSAPAKKK